MRGDLLELFCESPFRVPEIEGLLHPKPQAGSVPAELAQSDCHVGGNGGTPGEDAMQSLPRDPELAGRFTDGEPQ
jgi:hypothetical protein